MFMSLNAQAQASAKRISEFLNAKPEVVEPLNAISDVNLTGAIKAHNLSFTYPDSDKPTLHEINFEIKAGEMVGVLGRTGSGKSTLVELILHVYNTEKGMLYFDQYDINELSIKTLRDHIGYVPQDNFLYSDTIKK